ncbi:hypothetical protein CWE08_04495 [Aliidiomarina iranensis]|uniref:Fluoride-specific ion channel FluC n=1 Tax=Aliidiomarina iranensis TaxID=1434071 RepID=A0A432W0D0_9GAMM|nr:CrcB family protein [Aliidiomarina iranensis]RUO22442.1 hypothetical protein CWE08_04495 [Aliidiomarina iranensis]
MVEESPACSKKITNFALFSLMVALGGALGTLLRASIHLLMYNSPGELLLYANHHFPIVTVLVNSLGCFGLGFIYARYLVLKQPLDRQAQGWFLFFSSGVFAGLTTFSGFSKDLFSLLSEPTITAGFAVSTQIAALTYLLLSILFGLFMLMLGFLLARNRYNSGIKAK